MSPAATAPLVEAASGYFRPAGRFAWHFARGKLRGDPVFVAILERGLLAGATRILDLGCGQGLHVAWLLAARAMYEDSTAGWPAAWPPPPRLLYYSGIEIQPREVARARIAFARRGAGAQVQVSIEQADIARAAFAAADAILIMDVLHYLDRAAQERVLERVRAALLPAGRLLLRVGDAAAGLPFAASRVVDTAVALARRRRLLHLECRPLREWLVLLARVGLHAEALPMSAGTPFANHLLVARPA
jgi:SAM-dependent methyltransferase